MVEKRTGREYAAKIIDLSIENNSDAQAADLRTAARREIALLLKLQGHSNISTVFQLIIIIIIVANFKYSFCSLQLSYTKCSKHRHSFSSFSRFANAANSSTISLNMFVSLNGVLETLCDNSSTRSAISMKGNVFIAT